MNVSPDFHDVRAFHSRFGQPIDAPDVPVVLMPADQFTFRLKFLREEFDEYGVAYNKGNLIKAADALFDFVYVACGTALFMQASSTFFPTMPWPSFDRVKDQSLRFGFLAGRAKLPTLLSGPMHNLIHKRFTHEIEAFDLIHQSSESCAVPMALSHLWNATWAAYLAGVLMNLPWGNCWRHVQDANMAKVRAMKDGSDSTRQSSWDVVKPSGWCAPDAKIAMELALAGAIIPSQFTDEAKQVSQPRI